MTAKCSITCMGRATLRVLAGLVCVSSAWAAPEQDPMAGQQPIPMMAGEFQFRSGTWARYLFKPSDQPSSELEFSILDQVKQRRGTAWWMEIDITSKETDDVVTRVLLPETDKGPGDALKAIVQIEGYRPFEVPRKYLKPDPKKADANPVGDFTVYTPTGDPVAKQFTCNGRTINGMTVEALDPDGRPITIDVSPDVPPLGIVAVHSPNVSMDLLDWGDNAKTKISGKPVGLWRWVFGVAINAAKQGGDAQ